MANARAAVCAGRVSGSLLLARLCHPPGHDQDIDGACVRWDLYRCQSHAVQLHVLPGTYPGTEVGFHRLCSPVIGHAFLFESPSD